MKNNWLNLRALRNRIIGKFWSIIASPLMVVFKMRDSVPSARYSPICNVLLQWKTSLIPTYRVYRLYDITKTQKNKKEVGMLLPKKS